jgi:predicted short-subunit dehydrogenase-like oxidoreductase (DUF2520 family)
LSSRPAEDFILSDRNSIAVMNFSQDSARGIGTEFTEAPLGCRAVSRGCALLSGFFWQRTANCVVSSIDQKPRKTTNCGGVEAVLKSADATHSISNPMPPVSKRSHLKSKTSHSSTSRSKAKGLRISIVGAGRMGTALGVALRRAEHQIEVVVTKSAPSARRAAKLIGGGAAGLVERQPNHAPEATVSRLVQSDLLLISTPDDALEAVAARLAGTIRRTGADRGKAQRFALHTSGAVSSEVLAPLRALGFSVGSLHPLVSVADAAAVQDRFRGVHFCVEGDRAAARVARFLVKELGGRPFTISAEAKPLYHAAATVSSGHVTALFDVAMGMLRQCGITTQRARQILAPLLQSTAANLAAQSPAQALTGPFARGDVATVGKHLAAMKSKKMAEAADLYAALGLRALRLAESTKRNSRSAKDIKKLLSR